MWKSRKIRFALLLVFLAVVCAAAAAPAARAQCTYTQVSATITDPNGYPYSYGQVTYAITPSTATPTCNGQFFNGNPQSTQLDVNGYFSVSLPQNSAITPSGTMWTFAVTGFAGIPEPVGLGSQYWSIAPQSLTTSTLNLTSTFDAAATALVRISTTGGATSFSSLLSGTNTQAAMLCGTGCSLAPTGSGTITASNLLSGTVLGTTNEIAVSTTAGKSTISFTPAIILPSNSFTMNGLGVNAPAVGVTPNGGAGPGAFSCPQCYNYYVVATDVNGLTWTISGFTNAGAVTLSGTPNVSPYNTVSFSAWPGPILPVGSCTVYRATGQQPLVMNGIIGTISSCASGGTFQDYGQTATTASLPENTSGILFVTGGTGTNGISTYPFQPRAAIQTNGIYSQTSNGLFRPTSALVTYSNFMVDCDLGDMNALYFQQQFAFNQTYAVAVCNQNYAEAGNTNVVGGVLSVANSFEPGVDSLAFEGNCFTSVNGGQVNCFNLVLNDSLGLTSVSFLAGGEIDITPSNPPSVYGQILGLDLKLVDLYGNPGLYPAIGLKLDSFQNYPAVGTGNGYWLTGILFNTGDFEPGLGEAIYVLPNGTAISGTNYGSPVIEQACNSYWTTSAQADCYQTRVDVGPGNNPTDDYFTFYVSNSSGITNHHIRIDAAQNINIEFLETGSNAQFGVPPSQNVNSTFYLPPYAGTMFGTGWPSAPGTLNCLPDATSTTAYTLACSEFVDAASGGAVLGSATGGAQGSGTLNAVGLFVNGTAVSTATITFPASGDIVLANGTNTLAGIAPVNGDCVIGSGGAWVAGSCSGSSSTAWSTITAGTNTATGAFATAAPWTFSVAGAASTPAMEFTGVPYSGTGTTSTPLLYIYGGTAPTSWRSQGTAFGIALPSGSSANFLDFHLGSGSSVVSIGSSGLIQSAGGITSNGYFEVPSTAYYAFSSTSSQTGTVDSILCRLGSAGLIGVESAASCTNTVAGATGNFYAATYGTNTKCASGASPAGCGSAAAGYVAVPTGTTSSTLVVDTTAVTASSSIILTNDDTATISSTTCNTTLTTLASTPIVTARTAGTSFTITIDTTIATNPVCVNYIIVN